MLPTAPDSLQSRVTALAKSAADVAWERELGEKTIPTSISIQRGAIDVAKVEDVKLEPGKIIITPSAWSRFGGAYHTSKARRYIADVAGVRIVSHVISLEGRFKLCSACGDVATTESK